MEPSQIARAPFLGLLRRRETEIRGHGDSDHRRHEHNIVKNRPCHGGGACLGLRQQSENDDVWPRRAGQQKMADDKASEKCPQIGCDAADDPLERGTPAQRDLHEEPFAVPKIVFQVEKADQDRQYGDRDIETPRQSRRRGRRIEPDSHKEIGQEDRQRKGEPGKKRSTPSLGGRDRHEEDSQNRESAWVDRVDPGGRHHRAKSQQRRVGRRLRDSVEGLRTMARNTELDRLFDLRLHVLGIAAEHAIAQKSRRHASDVDLVGRGHAREQPRIGGVEIDLVVAHA